MYRDILRRVNSDTNLVVFESEDGNRHVVANLQRFVLPSGQYQHGLPRKSFVLRIRNVRCTAHAGARVKARTQLAGRRNGCVLLVLQ
jgi:hypothetical protein